jgi:hypothetical protein
VFPSDARISRRAIELINPGRLRQFPNQGVFASARTNHEDLHHGD